jgi:membrane protein required for colicin V production
MPQMIPTPEWRVAAAYAAVFIGSLIVTSLAGLLLSKVVNAVGLGGADRTLGAGFGAARGLLIIAAAALIAGLTSAPRQPYWRDSSSGPLLAQVAGLLKPLMPQTFAERLRYD